MKLGKKIAVLFLNLSISLLPIFVSPVQALTFTPTATASVSTLTLSANPDLTITFTQPAGDEVFNQAIVTIASGFNVGAGTSFAQDATLGTGTFTAIIGGVQQTVPVTFRNDLNLQGHKAYWKILFGDPAAPAVTLDSFLDGSSSAGHTFNITRKGLFTIEAPVTLTFTLNGVVGGTALFTNPTIGGEYTISTRFNAPSGAVVTKTSVANYPAPTPKSNSNVTDTFNGGISLTFDKVTVAGSTTVTSTSTAPPSGTGEFQLLGGLYYDFDTTATIRCPCIITMPYDPAVTSNPKIYHLESGTWVDRTTSVDTINHTVTGVVSSLSFFAVGVPNFNVTWLNPVAERLDKYGNPFPMKNRGDLEIKFNLLDSNNLSVDLSNVNVEIWQIADSSGSPITPIQSLTLTPKLDDKSDKYKTRLNLHETPLDLGTYEIHVVVDNTTATQTPQTASFTVVED